MLPLKLTCVSPASEPLRLIWPSTPDTELLKSTRSLPVAPKLVKARRPGEEKNSLSLLSLLSLSGSPRPRHSCAAKSPPTPASPRHPQRHPVIPQWRPGQEKNSLSLSSALSGSPASGLSAKKTIPPVRNSRENHLFASRLSGLGRGEKFPVPIGRGNIGTPEA